MLLHWDEDGQDICAFENGTLALPGDGMPAFPALPSRVRRRCFQVCQGATHSEKRVFALLWRSVNSYPWKQRPIETLRVGVSKFLIPDTLQEHVREPTNSRSGTAM